MHDSLEKAQINQFKQSFNINLTEVLLTWISTPMLRSCGLDFMLCGVT